MDQWKNAGSICHGAAFITWNRQYLQTKCKNFKIVEIKKKVNVFILNYDRKESNSEEDCNSKEDCSNKGNYYQESNSEEG